MNIEELDQALKAVCPVDGLSIGTLEDKATWRIDFREEATEQQRAAACAVLAGVVSLEIAIGAPDQRDPVQKIKDFLAANPDVLATINATATPDRAA